MQTLEISIWESGRPKVAQNNIFLKQDYKKIKKFYRKQISAGMTPLGCKFYLAFPNAQQHLDLVLEHISENNSKPTHPDKKTRSPATLNELVLALRELDHSRLEISINNAKKHPLPPEISLILELISEINSGLISWLENKSPFILSSPNNSNKAWWNLHPKPRGIAQSISHKIKRLYASNIPDQLKNLNSWLLQLEKNINYFCVNNQLGWNTSSTIKHASAYCAGIAERQLLHGDHNLAIIFYHRSVDLLLYSICAEQGLIDFSRNWGFGAYKANKLAPVTLRNSLTELTNYLNSSSTRENTFENLNSWRNQLIQTHYLTTADQTAIDSLAIKVRAELELISTNDWRKARDFFTSSPPISYSEIININNCTSSLFEEVYL